MGMARKQLQERPSWVVQEVAPSQLQVIFNDPSEGDTKLAGGNMPVDVEHDGGKLFRRVAQDLATQKLECRDRVLWLGPSIFHHNLSTSTMLNICQLN